jgi:hypothetical protein
VKVEIRDKNGSVIDDATSLALQTEGMYKQTKSLLLVSDNEDDLHPDTDMGPENLPGDRSHKISLGGTFHVTEIKIGDQVQEAICPDPSGGMNSALPVAKRT